jgi:hypothetical protein
MKYKIMTPKGEYLAECEGSSKFMGIPTWKINGHDYSHILIKELGLTVEPYEEPVKKLYAIREISNGAISFYDKEVILYKSQYSDEVLRERAPELDIVYPIGET